MQQRHCQLQTFFLFLFRCSGNLREEKTNQNTKPLHQMAMKWRGCLIIVTQQDEKYYNKAFRTTARNTTHHHLVCLQHLSSLPNFSLVSNNHIVQRLGSKNYQYTKAKNMVQIAFSQQSLVRLHARCFETFSEIRDGQKRHSVTSTRKW